jgi:glutamate--cysteine ligase
MTVPPPHDTTLIGDPEQLLEPFQREEKPRERWRVGVEVEKFGVLARTLEPLDYEGESGAVRVLEQMAGRFGWHPKSEFPGGPVIGLERAEASVSLEPGAQVELGSEPCSDLHALSRSFGESLVELATVGDSLGLEWLEVGFHPLARLNELPRVPKRRYPIMREYLPTCCTGGLDMMFRTAALQASFDYSSEQDALRKMTALLRIAPLLNAITANSPFWEGQVSGHKSLRGLTWIKMDPARSGLIPNLWSGASPRYRHYVEWALDASMFFFVRDGELVMNTGQTFRNFYQHGFQGHRATVADWGQHLNTLFPEVRLRKTLEVRTSDTLPSALTLAVPALLVGLLYDEQALDETLELSLPWSYVAVERSRHQLATHGLDTRLAEGRARQLAEQLLGIALGGLRRRARLDALGRDETQYLEGLAAFIERGLCPADLLTEDLPRGARERAREIVHRTRLSLAPRPLPRPGKRCPGREAHSSE